MSKGKVGRWTGRVAAVLAAGFAAVALNGAPAHADGTWDTPPPECGVTVPAGSPVTADDGSWD